MATAGTSRRMGRREWALFLLLSVLWGGSFFFYKIIVAALPPVTVAFGRVALAAIALHFLVLLRGERMPAEPRLWLRFARLGILNNAIPFSLFAFGETRITSGLAAILNAATPIFTVLVAHWLTADERLTRNKAFGVLFGFLGVAVLIGPGALAGFADGNLLGEGACLLAAFTYAFGALYGRNFRALSPLHVATGQVTASALVLLPVSLLVDRPWLLPMPGAATWAALAGIALGSTALAYVIFFRILAVAGATNLSVVTFLIPVSALLLGALFLGEPPTERALLGMAIIGCGLAAIDGRIPALILARRPTRPETAGHS